MKVLVTGGSGYIGSVLVPRLIQNGHQVVVVDRFFFGDSLQEDSQLTKIKADSRDLDKSYFKGIDAVIDLVAMSVNDLIVQGAKPIFFLDYIAINKNEYQWRILFLLGLIIGANIYSYFTTNKEYIIPTTKALSEGVKQYSIQN